MLRGKIFHGNSREQERRYPTGALYNQLWLRRKELSELRLFHRTRRELFDNFAVNINFEYIAFVDFADLWLNTLNIHKY